MRKQPWKVTTVAITANPREKTQCHPHNVPNIATSNLANSFTILDSNDPHPPPFSKAQAVQHSFEKLGYKILGINLLVKFLCTTHLTETWSSNHHPPRCPFSNGKNATFSQQSMVGTETNFDFLLGFNCTQSNKVDIDNAPKANQREPMT